MAVIKSGATTDQLTIDATSKAARVTLYDSTGRQLSTQGKPTYFAAGSFTPAATPTDLVTILGSASKTVRVVSLKLSTTNTAAGSQEFVLLRRSAANTGGTFVAATAVAADSTDSAATAVVGHYTANAGALGATAGNLAIARVASPAAIPSSFAGVREDAGVDLLDVLRNIGLAKLPILNGVTQVLAVNFAGAALVAGQTHAYTVVWIEE